MYFYISKNITHRLNDSFLKSSKAFSVYLTLEVKFGDDLLR